MDAGALVNIPWTQLAAPAHRLPSKSWRSWRSRQAAQKPFRYGVVIAVVSSGLADKRYGNTGRPRWGDHRNRGEKHGASSPARQGERSRQALGHVVTHEDRRCAGTFRRHRRWCVEKDTDLGIVAGEAERTSCRCGWEELVHGERLTPHRVTGFSGSHRTETSHSDRYWCRGIPVLPVDDSRKELIWSDLDGGPRWEDHDRSGENQQAQSRPNSSKTSHLRYLPTWCIELVHAAPGETGRQGFKPIQEDYPRSPALGNPTLLY
jgi:hypothetical protein